MACGADLLIEWRPAARRARLASRRAVEVWGTGGSGAAGAAARPVRRRSSVGGHNLARGGARGWCPAYTLALELRRLLCFTAVKGFVHIP